ncbi:MAG: hypothetical protein IKU25_03090 [Clostridia bacterium]|nr:hypothetical protein [Clostridia bacterium]
MLCQNCMKNEANTHIKQSINGETQESYLCFECYTKLGHGSFNENFSFGFSELLNHFFGDGLLLGPKEQVLRCPKCSNTYETIAKNGKVGCEKCYETFYENMKFSLQKIHGKVKHVGKKPVGKGGADNE